MRKIIKALLVVLVLAMALTALAACDLFPTKEPEVTEPTPCEHKGGAATCEEAAICETCGESYGEALGHDMSEATCTEAPACKREGCDHTEGKALGHKNGFTASVQPTCTEEGISSSQYCTVCQEVFVEAIVIPAKGHAWVDATCTKPKTCDVCGETEGDPIAHTWTDVEGKAPTCTEPGYTAHKVCTCKATEGKEVIDATGHNWTDATCTSAKTCGACGATEGEALGHTPGAEPTCTKDQTCTVCGETVAPKLGHVDANLDIDCDRDGCTGKVAPAADSFLSNFTANNLGSKLSTSVSYYVVGTIAEVLDAKNGIFLIDDGTGETFYFRLPKDAEGVSHANWEIKLVLGDKVQVYGKVGKFTSSDAPNGQYWPSIQGGVVTILEQHPHDFTLKPAGCSDPAYCACGQSYGEPLGCFDNDGNDICDDCGKNVNYVYEFIEIRTDNESGVIDTTAGTYTWGNDNFSIYVAKGTSSQLYSTAKDHMRVYKGNNLVIVNKNGIDVKTITVYVTNATQVDYFAKFLTGYTYTTNKEDFSVTFEVSALTTLTLTNTSSTTQIKGVELSYEKPEDPALSNATIDLSTQDNRTFYDAADKQVWEQNGIKVTNTKGESTSNVPDKTSFQTNSKGALIIEGKGIKTIVITSSTNTTYKTYLNTVLTEAAAAENASFTFVKNDNVFTLTLKEKADSFTIDYLAKAISLTSITINPEA